ncbi:MAG: orotidine 5'-phosphate decarboxylase / HUMPS family protein [Candidatus Heimdallarchaeota archaeon]
MSSYDQNFLKKYEKSRNEKNSILCAGFDPAIPNQREKNVIAEKYFKGSGSAAEASQYIFHMGISNIQKMNKMIHEQGITSLFDHKISDIGSTNDSGFYWIKEMGFDGTTHSPFAGNIEESLISAHKHDLGLVTLTLMSNPDSIYFMKESIVDGMKGYEFIANKLKEFNGDGMVVGATGHVTTEDIQKIRKLAGKDVVMLVPGIGKQQGDLKKVIEHGGKNVILNVSRGILYSDDIRATAKSYNERFNEIRLGK